MIRWRGAPYLTPPTVIAESAVDSPPANWLQPASELSAEIAVAPATRQTNYERKDTSHSPRPPHATLSGECYDVAVTGAR
jgi:hypothetical protein